MAETRRRGEETRERILDVALRRFVDQGYEATSLREIAEDMGFSKAALYYHFASKDEILMALHLRLHALGRGAFTDLGDGPPDRQAWGEVLETLLDALMSNRDLMILHGREMQVMEEVLKSGHSHDHEDDEDLMSALQRLTGDESIPVRDRIRLAAVVAVLTSTFMMFDVLNALPMDELRETLRELIWDILGPTR